jgi:hypothetical protein
MHFRDFVSGRVTGATVIGRRAQPHHPYFLYL